MASNRHLGRVIVLQSLYEYELRTLAKDPEVDLDIVVAKNIEPYEKALGDTEFVYNLARKVAENFETLDKVLTPLAPEWPIASIAAIGRNVLRMGLYELSECRDSIPPKVAINEAVELAKEFGSENSSRFINGVLGTAYKQLGINETDNNGKKQAKSGSVSGEAKADEAADETAKATAATTAEAAAEDAKDSAKAAETATSATAEDKSQKD